MILGVDHIGWSVRDPLVAADTLTHLGYRRAFEEPRLPTADAKRPLLRTFTPIHSIEYWRHPRGPAIETISHGGAGPYAETPTVRFGPDGAIEAYLLSPLEPQRAREVWHTALGARVTTEAGVLRVASRLPQWCLDVHIRDHDGRSRADRLVHLDDEGFVSVALITTDLGLERSRLALVGVQTVEPFRVRVNGRDLKVTLGRGAAGEIIELLEVVAR